MFRKTRRKMVLSVLAVLLLFLAVTLSAVYGFSYLSLKRQNREMLERYVSMYSLEELPGEEPSYEPGAGMFPEGSLPGEGPVPFAAEPATDLMPDSAGAEYRLSSFYSAAINENGEVLAVDTGRGTMYQENEISALAEKILEMNRKSGMHGSLMYQVESRDTYTLVAFVDTTLTDSNLRTLLISTFAVGILAVGIFCVLSVFMARALIRPLEENDRRQKQFISDAGHELKTPISVIGANAEVLERQIGENRWLSNIRYENQRMGNLVKDLMELSHAETRNLPAEKIDFSKLTEQEVLPFESVAFEKGMTIRTRVGEDVKVSGNRQQLGQLVCILTDNAVSHSTGSGEIEIELEKKHRMAVLSVVNPGPEIPRETMERLFDRFYRADEARGGSGSHFGLGLSIARAITDAHRGRLTAECKNGKIIFTASIPVEK